MRTTKMKCGFTISSTNVRTTRFEIERFGGKASDDLEAGYPKFGARLCEVQLVALQIKPLRVTDPRSVLHI